MGIAVADLDRDQRLDFYVTNFQREYNTYYRQSRSGGWEDQTIPFQLAQPTIPLVGFGTQAADLDHDGFAELVVTNGHIDYPAPVWNPIIFNPSRSFARYQQSSSNYGPTKTAPIPGIKTRWPSVVDTRCQS